MDIRIGRRRHEGCRECIRRLDVLKLREDGVLVIVAGNDGELNASAPTTDNARIRSFELVLGEQGSKVTQVETAQIQMSPTNYLSLCASRVSSHGGVLAKIEARWAALREDWQAGLCRVDVEIFVGNLMERCIC